MGLSLLQETVLAVANAAGLLLTKTFFEPVVMVPLGVSCPPNIVYQGPMDSIET